MAARPEMTGRIGSTRFLLRTAGNDTGTLHHDVTNVQEIPHSYGTGKWS
jgi:hypothetical protein